MSNFEKLIDMPEHSPICIKILPSGEYIFSKAEVIRNINHLGLLCSMKKDIMDYLTIIKSDNTTKIIKLNGPVSNFSVNSDGTIYYDILNGNGCFELWKYEDLPFTNPLYGS